MYDWLTYFQLSKLNFKNLAYGGIRTHNRRLVRFQLLIHSLDFPLKTVTCSAASWQKSPQFKCETILTYKYSPWPRGLMDKASDFGSEDCEFESRRGQLFLG